MRIASVEISGFRAFSGTERFDLDGDIVLVVGVNGQGKTSLFDAIHWAITGSLSRLEEPESIVSLYCDTGEARVEVKLKSDCGRCIVVTRQFDGHRHNLRVTDGDESFRGDHAELELLRRLWPAGLTASQPKVALRSALERGVYLQQDVITGFLTADTDQQRFNSISELIGVGTATELQESLERSRSTWSRITNQRESQVAAAEHRLSLLEGQLQELNQEDRSEKLTKHQWDAWWGEAIRLGVSRDGAPAVTSADANSAIDVAMAELRAIRSRQERNRDWLKELAAMLQDHSSTAPNLAALRRTADEASVDLVSARNTLAAAKASYAAIKQRERRKSSEQEDFRLLAEVALRHLGEHCPVCQQAYDIQETRERLRAQTQAFPTDDSSATALSNLTLLAERVQALEEEFLRSSPTVAGG